MNVIYEAILKGKIENNVPGKHTWKELKKFRHVPIYLFGATKASKYFLDTYAKKYRINGIFDNDCNKQNTFYEGIIVQSPESIKTMNTNLMAVVITSTNYYQEIYQQLVTYKVDNIFILPLMEKKRLSVKIKVSIVGAMRNIKNSVWKMVEHYWGWNKGHLKKRSLMKHFHELPVEKNKIIFMAGGEYKDHEKYISETLNRQDNTLKLVWILREGVKTPDYVRRVDINDSNAVLKELATSKIWLNSSVFPIYVKKRKGQIYIQTKHWSSITLKKFMFDTQVYFKNSPWLRNEWHHDKKMYDYILIGSEFDKRTCKSGFRYHGKFINSGSPRTDALFVPELYKEKIFDRYQIEKGAKIVLYAPTFRLYENGGKIITKSCECVPDFSRMTYALEEKFGGHWEIVLRLHPHAAWQSQELVKKYNVIDMSQYEDIQELLAISDIVITDYSSLMFEPAMVGKKVFLYTPDLEEYINNERGLWFDLKDLPFPIAKDDVELLQAIATFDEEIYQKTIKLFLDKHGVMEDGHASERAAKFILELVNN